MSNSTLTKDERDALRERMRERGIRTIAYYTRARAEEIGADASPLIQRLIVSIGAEKMAHDISVIWWRGDTGNERELGLTALRAAVAGLDLDPREAKGIRNFLARSKSA